MTFADIPSGAALFVDANALVYHYNPSHVQQLSEFRAAVDEVLQSGLQVLLIPPPLIATAAAVSQQFGLLSGDALVVAVMREHGLMNLASHDADFDRVPGLARYAPA